MLDLQNDHQNLSFVKAINAVGKKMARNLMKWQTPRFVIFVSKQSLEGSSADEGVLVMQPGLDQFSLFFKPCKATSRICVAIEHKTGVSPKKILWLRL